MSTTWVANAAWGFRTTLKVLAPDGEVPQCLNAYTMVERGGDEVLLALSSIVQVEQRSHAEDSLTHVQGEPGMLARYQFDCALIKAGVRIGDPDVGTFGHYLWLSSY